MERVSPAVRNVRAARGVPMPTAHIAARAGLSGLGGAGAGGGRTHHHASPAVLALLVTAAIVLMLQVGGTLWRRESAGDASSAAYYDEVRTMATAFLRSGRGDGSGSGGSTAVGHTHADGTVHGAAAAAAPPPPGLTQADVDRAVSDALAAQEAALLRKLTAAGAVAASGHGHGGVGGAGGGSCPDYASTVRSKVGSGDVRLVVVVFGTRPEAIKLAPLVTELTAAAAQSDRTGSRVAVVTVATGQHESMLKSALEAFTIVPDVSLDLMSHGQTLGALGGRLLTSLSCVLDSLHKAPGMAVGGVVVQGDTITASQAASAAFFLGLPVAHVEAGLRTFMADDPYPEEVARTTITAQASLHLAPTRYAADVLVQSGVCPEAVTVTGNTGIDALVGILRAGPSADAKKALQELQLPVPDGPALAAAITGNGAPPAGAGADGQKGPVTVVVTMHRRENIGARMAGMLEAVKTLAAQHAGGLRLLLPVHPNPAVKAAVEGALTGVPGVSLLPPLPYDSFVWVLAAASAVLTDSGGLQEEAVALGRHVFVMRQTSERPEALRTGLGRLVGTDPAGIADALSEWLAALRNGAGGGNALAWPTHLRPRAGARRTFGDGSASKRIAGVLVPWAQSAASAAGGLGAAPCRVGTLASASAGGAPAIGSGAPGARALTDHTVHAFGAHGGLGDSGRHHGGTLLTGHARFGHTVECAAQPDSPRPPQRQYGDAMAQPSFYDNGRDKDADAYGVTAIVAVWKRPQVLPRMLDGLLGQGHPVREVWVTTFASDHVDEFRRIVDEYQARDPAGRKGRVKFVAGDPQFKYFGRFALALMAKTPHVLLLDDDSIPGARVLQNGLHMMYTRSGEYYGLIGMKGHDAHVEDAATNIMPDYFSAFVARPDKVVQVDLCGGFWLARTEWLRSMYAEAPLTWESGEDFHVTAMLRKLEGLPTFLLPSDMGDTATWGHTHDFIDISAAGDSTSDFMHKYRSNVAYGHFAQGYEPVHAADTWGERHGRANVVLLVRSDADAAAVAPLYAALSASPLGEYVRPHVVLAVDPRATAGGVLDGASQGSGTDDGSAGGWARSPHAKAEFLQRNFGIGWELPQRRVGVWDLNIGRVPALPDVPDLPPPRVLEGQRLSRTPVHISTRAATVFTGILHTLRPALVVAVYDEGSPVTAGVALAAGSARVPLLGLALPPSDDAACGAAPADGGHVNTYRAVLTAGKPGGSGGLPAWRGTDRPVCEPHHPWMVARGGFNAVTNSPGAALAHVADTLCACESPDSRSGRAYARCPSDVDVGSAPR